MKVPLGRAVAASLFVAALGAALGACGTDSGGGGFVYSGSGPAVDCHAYSTCSTCTPVEGCGWCYNAGSPGTCESSPAACPGQSFTWTWDPMGCYVPAEASVGSVEASTADAGSVDAAGSD